MNYCDFNSIFDYDKLEKDLSSGIDGLILTYQVRNDRRYISYNSGTKTITINGGVNNGENIQIYI